MRPRSNASRSMSHACHGLLAMASSTGAWLLAEPCASLGLRWLSMLPGVAALPRWPPASLSLLAHFSLDGLLGWGRCSRSPRPTPAPLCLCASLRAVPARVFRVTYASCFRVDVSIPSSFVPGNYTLDIDNGLAATLDGSWRLPIRVDPQPTGSPISLQLAARAGVSSRVLPRQQLQVAVSSMSPRVSGMSRATRELVLARGVRLVGASASASVLHWADNTVSGAPAVGLACSSGAMVNNVSLLFTSPIQVRCVCAPEKPRPHVTIHPS